MYHSVEPSLIYNVRWKIFNGKVVYFLSFGSKQISFDDAYFGFNIGFLILFVISQIIPLQRDLFHEF